MSAPPPASPQHEVPADEPDMPPPEGQTLVGQLFGWAADAFKFQAIYQDEVVIKDLVEREERPRVWASFGRRWKQLEIVANVKHTTTPMYGLMEPPPEAKEAESEGETPKDHASKSNDNIYLLYPELLNVTEPKVMKSLQPCYLWHHKRRIQMLMKYPEIRKLMRLEHKPTYQYWLGGLLCLHLLFSYAAASFYSSLGMEKYLVVFGMAWFAGSGFAFNLQQLTHEISHNVLEVGYTLHVLMFLSDLSFGICGPGWHSYYMLLHLQHHSYAGSNGDPDVSFQTYWSILPSGLTHSRFGRFVWLTLFGLFTQILVLTCHCFGVNRLNFLMEHKLELFALLSFKCGFWILCYYTMGFGSVLYLWLSSGMALGAFAHPYIGFWLIQHLAVYANGHQPTVSYGGSEWWQFANFGALRHVEHHDFPTIPFNKCHLIRTIAPEFYDDLYQVNSIADVTWEWLSHTNGTAWMDFAANQRYVMSQTELPMVDKTRPETFRGLLEPVSKRAKELMKPDPNKLLKHRSRKHKTDQLLSQKTSLSMLGYDLPEMDTDESLSQSRASPISEKGFEIGEGVIESKTEEVRKAEAAKPKQSTPFETENAFVKSQTGK